MPTLQNRERVVQKKVKRQGIRRFKMAKLQIAACGRQHYLNAGSWES
jgi:hypothetical protein